MLRICLTSRDALLTSGINCGTSLLAGFAVFSVLGHMAYTQNTDVDQVARDGNGIGAFFVWKLGYWDTIKWIMYPPMKWGAILFIALFVNLSFRLSIRHAIVYALYLLVFTNNSAKMSWCAVRMFDQGRFKVEQCMTVSRVRSITLVFCFWFIK